MGMQRHRSRQIDAELRSCIENLRRKLGEKKYKEAMAWLAARDYTSLADMMLDYYDGLYDHHRQTNTSQLRKKRPTHMRTSTTFAWRSIALLTCLSLVTAAHLTAYNRRDRANRVHRRGR